jgi:hypothetical protein
VTNPVFGVVFVLVWVGLVPVSLLGGALWRGMHPVRTFAGWFKPADRRILIDRLGVYPAALGILGWGWFELIQPDRATLPVLRGFVIAWVLLVVIGTLWRGLGWIGSADPFDAYAAMVTIAAGLYVAGVAALRWGLTVRTGLLETADSLSIGLVPIVAGYALGHYLPLLRVMVVYTVGGLVLLFSP